MSCRRFWDVERVNSKSFVLPPALPLPSPASLADREQEYAAQGLSVFLFFARSFFYILLCMNLVSLSQIGIEGAAIARTGQRGASKQKTKKKRRVPLPHQPHRQRPWTTQLVYDALEAGIMTSCPALGRSFCCVPTGVAFPRDKPGARRKWRPPGRRSCHRGRPYSLGGIVVYMPSACRYGA